MTDGYLARLKRPEGMADVVLDTDAYNEIDDQYALAYMLRSDEKLNVRAVYAAPFVNERAATPAEGMEKSYGEILKIGSLLDIPVSDRAFKGSTAHLKDEKTALPSDAARDLASRAMSYSPEAPLYVVAIGAVTNVASALLMNPAIGDRMVVVWLGGHSYFWPHTREFNLCQDFAAARVVFGSKAAMVQVPCMGVASAFRISRPEIEYWLRGKNKLCDYLAQVTLDAQKNCVHGAWSRPLWDVTAVSWLLGERFAQDTLVHAPMPEYGGVYSYSGERKLIRSVYAVDRDALMDDLIKKLL